jgi:hypothetical protein
VNITSSPKTTPIPRTPNGQFVAFVSNRDGNDEIYETNDRFQLAADERLLPADTFLAFARRQADRILD